MASAIMLAATRTHRLVEVNRKQSEQNVSPPATLPVACASLKIISSSAVKGITSLRPAAYGRGTLDELSGVPRPERDPPAAHAAQPTVGPRCHNFST